jgi:uncharacterized protein
MRWIPIGLAGLVVLLVALVRLWGEDYPSRFLNPGVQGAATPALFGLAHERLSIASGRRRLDAFYVPAPRTCAKPVAVLIYHGRGETVASWFDVQKLLYGHCIASLVFDYTGHGRSSPHGTIRRLNEDAVAAYDAFTAKTPGLRRCIFGFSMGAGPMLAATPRFAPRPDCVVVAGAFTSLRDLAVKNGVPRWLMTIAPDSWDNTRAIADLHAPVMILHSRADRGDPYWMGEALFAAANPPKCLAPLAGFRHDAAHEHPSEAWWKPAIDFIQG